MKELIQAYVAQFPDDLFALIFERKSFIARKNNEKSKSVVEPLCF